MAIDLSPKDLALPARGVNHFSPLVDMKLQINTSDIGSWVQRCDADQLENCALLKPIHDAFQKFRDETPGAGAYFNEADYFDDDWQENFWGMDNYMRLLDIKQKWDPEQLFYCHKCVGSEFWEEGGMCRRPALKMN